MRIERTNNAEMVRSILTFPGVRADVWEGDGEIPVPIHHSIYHLIVRCENYNDGAVSEPVIGVVAFMPINSITWNPHIAILPAYRGNGTLAMADAISWMAQNTPCRKLVAYPPEFNAKMIRVFEKCGFNKEGYSPKSFHWRGSIHGRVLMGKEIEPCGLQ
jgi:RimJ/RimL family protein N-acetyltransferase